MKKLYILSFLLIPFMVTSQTSININGSSDVISGGTHFETVSSADPVDISFDINNEGSAATWRVT